MIALPMISALVAPTAANAQSFENLAFGATCTSSNQCSSSVPNCARRVGGGRTGSRCCIGLVITTVAKLLIAVPEEPAAARPLPANRMQTNFAVAIRQRQAVRAIAARVVVTAYL